MMEYKYYRELKHNYLIVKKEGEEADGDRYRYRIAESGRIRGLIPCSERNVNGESYYYYEIGSMQTIRDRFAVSKMNVEQLSGLLRDMRSVLLELGDFLLGQEGIVFNTGNIYTDYSAGEFKLMYCPFFDEEKSFEEFAMDLLSLVDEQDQKAADLVYRLCERSSYKGDFVYELLEECLQMVAEEDEDEGEDVPARMPASDEPLWEEDTPVEGMPEPERSGRISRLTLAGKRLSGKMQLLFSLMFFALLGAMVYIRLNYILSSEENMLSILVILVSAVTGVIALVGGFREMKASPRAAEDTAPKTATPVAMEDSFFDDDFEDFRKEKTVESRAVSFAKKPIQVTGSFTKKEESFGGETIVLDQKRAEGLALFSRNLDKTVRIPLDNLPFTIGKMEGCVDKALSDSSVSRIHCRFEREGDTVCVRDLGSTNGTYKNGLRLSPQQTVAFDEGDEIRIGRVCFDCR